MAKEIERKYTARLVAEEIEPRGLGPVQIMPANHGFDLLVGRISVEVKIARARPRRQSKEVYQGMLRDPVKGRKLDGEVVILVCVDPDDRLWVFIIPRLFVGNRRDVQITSRPDQYSGQWARWLGAWNVLD